MDDHDFDDFRWFGDKARKGSALLKVGSEWDLDGIFLVEMFMGNVQPHS